jgi:hypothetical protein
MSLHYDCYYRRSSCFVSFPCALLLLLLFFVMHLPPSSNIYLICVSYFENQAKKCRKNRISTAPRLRGTSAQLEDFFSFQYCGTEIYFIGR